MLSIRHLWIVFIVLWMVGIVISQGQAQLMPSLTQSMTINGQNSGQWQHWGFQDLTKIYQQMSGVKLAVPTPSVTKQVSASASKNATVTERPDGKDTMNLLMAEVIGEINYA